MLLPEGAGTEGLVTCVGGAVVVGVVVVGVCVSNVGVLVDGESV